MLTGALTVQNLRQTYLRGIDLGASWYGPGADAALAQLLDVQLSRAEALMAIQFRPFRVATQPEATWEAGRDYDLLGAPVPYVVPEPTATVHAVRLAYHDVQALARVRVFQGYTTGTPPAPLYATLDLNQITFLPPDETVRIPVALVPQPELAQAWVIDYAVGLGQIPLEVAAWVQLGVAIEVLSMVASNADVSGGAAGTRLSMDDITEDIRYNRAEEGGIYGATISKFEYLRDEIELVKLRMRYQGMAWYTQVRTPPSLG
jgi:hypothetical protein